MAQTLIQDDEGVVANGVRYNFKDLGIDTKNGVSVVQRDGALYINGVEMQKEHGEETVDVWDVAIMAIAIALFALLIW